ncbi:MAG: TGS domain-containing protein [bacterium]|nr:TGS domain-containing protein [bacterium]
MPANLTAQYRAADAKYRSATSDDERRAALEEMLSTVPKHKGTEKLQADIKRRLARLRLAAEHRQAKKGFSMHVEAEGAGQILLLGRPNCGKSSLLGLMTRAEPNIADYPFATTGPQPGMMKFEDIQIQLVDLPPITADHMDTWIPGLAQAADGALLLADPDRPGVLAGIEEIQDQLASVHVPLVGSYGDAEDPRDLQLPTLLVITKADLAAEEDIEVIEELYGDTFPVVRFSAGERIGVQALRTSVWSLLEQVRAYTKKPGKKAERTEPYVLAQGSSVSDLASRIHRDLAESYSSAKVWGGKLNGQKVARDFELRDRDIVEFAG